MSETMSEESRDDSLPGGSKPAAPKVSVRKQRLKLAEGDAIYTEEPFRARMWEFMDSQRVEHVVACVILVNFVAIAKQINDEAMCMPLPAEFHNEEECFEELVGTWQKGTAMCFLMFYSAETLCRLFVERSHYFTHQWNYLDLFVVLTGWIGDVILDIGSLQAVRIVRIVRMVRLIRVLTAFEELYIMLSSLSSMLKSLMFGFGFLVLFGLATFWSIVLVEFVHPIVTAIDYEALGCDRCERAYGSIFAANLTIWQQIITGDSWGQLNVPIIEKAPWAAFILCGVMISIDFGLINLILATILERMQSVREDDDKLRALEREKEHQHQHSKIERFCKQLDQNGTGKINAEELCGAWSDNGDFQELLVSMDIQENDLPILFRMLDVDGDGDVSYEEFCEELYKIRSRNMHTMLSLMKLSINEIFKIVSAGGGSSTPFPRDISRKSTLTTAPRASTETGLGQEPTLAGRLFSELFPGDPAPFGNLARQADELEHLKRSVTQCVEVQVASLLATVREEWVFNGDGGLAFSGVLAPESELGGDPACAGGKAQETDPQPLYSVTNGVVSQERGGAQAEGGGWQPTSEQLNGSQLPAAAPGGPFLTSRV